MGVMYPEFVVCNVPRNRITNAKNSTIFYFKSVSTWQEDLLRMHEAHKDSWDMTMGLHFYKSYENGVAHFQDLGGQNTNSGM